MGWAGGEERQVALAERIYSWKTSLCTMKTFEGGKSFKYCFLKKSFKEDTQDTQMFFNMKIFKEYISHAILKILKGGSFGKQTL